MEFQEFCKKRLRMCEAIHNSDCGLCHPSFGGCHTCEQRCIANPERAEGIVEQWVKEHPIVRNCDKLYEVFGNDFTMMMRDTSNVFIHHNGEEIPMSEWMYQEYKEQKKVND